jgi:hypothetical protein
MKFIQSLVARIGQYGVENVADAMNNWLDRYSELASGDDMTLVFVLIRSQTPVKRTQETELKEMPSPSWGF